MQTAYSLAVEALAVLISRAHLVPADSGNESPDRCKKEVFVTGAHQSTECADEDQHEGNDKGLRAHEAFLLRSSRDAAKTAIEGNAALVIARTTNWLNLKRKRVIAVVVFGGVRSAVNTEAFDGLWEFSLFDSRNDLATSSGVLYCVLGRARDAQQGATGCSSLRFVAAANAGYFSVNRHDSSRLEFEPKGALIATRLGPELAIGQTLDLKLSFVGGVLVPLGDGSRLDAQQRSKGASGPGMVDSGLSFHDGR